MLWWYIIQTIAKDPCRVGFYLPLTCNDEKTFVKGDSSDLINLPFFIG